MKLTVFIWILGIIALNLSPIFFEYNTFLRAFESACFGWVIGSYVSIYKRFENMQDTIDNLTEYCLQEKK